MVDVNQENFSAQSFHCKSPRKLKLSKLDPSCCIGFYCATRADFDSFVASVQPVSLLYDYSGSKININGIYIFIVSSACSPFTHPTHWLFAPGSVFDVQWIRLLSHVRLFTIAQDRSPHRRYSADRVQNAIAPTIFGQWWPRHGHCSISDRRRWGRRNRRVCDTIKIILVAKYAGYYNTPTSSKIITHTHTHNYIYLLQCILKYPTTISTKLTSNLYAISLSPHSLYILMNRHSMFCCVYVTAISESVHFKGIRYEICNYCSDI